MPEKSTTTDLEQRIREWVEAVNRRDWDGYFKIFSPDVIWDTSALGMGVFEGRDSIRTGFEDYLEAFEEYEVRLDEFHDLGNGVTLFVAFDRARPKGSSAFLEDRFADLAIWADGLIERATTYTDIDQARADAERLAEERG